MKRILFFVIIALVFTFTIISCTPTKNCPAYGNTSVDTEQVNDKV